MRQDERRWATSGAAPSARGRRFTTTTDRTTGAGLSLFQERVETWQDDCIPF
jgi:hypothetical protein